MENPLFARPSPRQCEFEAEQEIAFFPKMLGTQSERQASKQLIGSPA